MQGYQPQFHMPASPNTYVPEANERIRQLAEVREDTAAALRLVAERMKAYHDKHVQSAPVLCKGQKVWLDTCNLCIVGIPRKLADKFAGPYPVTRQVSELAYELKLPHTMKIHPVFHVSLLRPHRKSNLPGRKHPEPVPIEVDGKEEYKVAEIRDSRYYGKWHKLQYLV